MYDLSWLPPLPDATVAGWIGEETMKKQWSFRLAVQYIGVPLRVSVVDQQLLGMHNWRVVVEE